MKLAMIDSGHVSLVSGAGFADFGDEVVGADKEPSKIPNLNDNIMPFRNRGPRGAKQVKIKP